MFDAECHCKFNVLKEERMKRLRNNRGGAIAFGAVLALVLVVLGAGFVLISLYMGGQTETKNASDAGA